MIEIFEGRLGGGKSYHAVKRLVDYVANGGCVWTNLELFQDEIKKYLLEVYQWELQPGQINIFDGTDIVKCWEFVPPGCPDSPNLIILDEAHIYLNARDWNKASRPFLEFMTHTRHLSIDVIFISQSMFNIDKQIARLVGYIWRFRDMQKWGCAEVGIMWPFPQFMSTQYDFDGKSMIRPSSLEWKNHNIYKLYNTYQLVSKFPLLEQRKRKMEGKVKGGKKKMKTLFILLVLCLVGLFGWRFWQDRKHKDQVAVYTEALAGQVNTSVLQVSSREKSIPRDEEDSKNVYKEPFLIIMTNMVMTDEDWYRENEYCKRGKVLKVQERMIYIRGFDSRPIVVIQDVRKQRLRRR